MGTLPTFFSGPLSNITPFTYRDGETYLSQLKRMRSWINEIFDALQGDVEQVRDENIAAIAELAQLIAALNLKWQEIENGKIVFDPTTGVNSGINLVLGHIFDNTRYYAYFAEQLDTFDYTAAQWDTLDYTARHFDLNLAYSPTETQAVKTVPATVIPN